VVRVQGFSYTTEGLNKMICPRCNSSQIPNNETPGAYPGALSRADNKTEICSRCGSHEAAEAYYNFAYGIPENVTPISQWPMQVYSL